MAKKFFNMVYNPMKFRIRGSFVSIVTTILMWAINIAILALVWRQVYFDKETLSSLSVFLSVWLAFVKASYVYITTVYMNNKTKIELEDKRFEHACSMRNSGGNQSSDTDQEYEK